MKKEWSRSSEAVADAIMTLQQYYSKGAFAQRQPDFGGAKTDIGTTIISMLEVAESDLNTLLAEVHNICLFEYLYDGGGGCRG